MTKRPVAAENSPETLHELCQTLTETPAALPEIPTTAPEPQSKPGIMGFLGRIAPEVDVLSKLATVAVLGLAFWQYYEAGQDQKRERSLELVSEWVDAGHPDRIARISGFFYASAAQSRAQVDALPETMRDKAWANANDRIIGSLVSPDAPEAVQTRDDIDRLFRFFVRAEICVSSGLCDADVARDYFLIEAKSLTEELAPFVERVRETGLPTYGRAAETFVDRVASE